MSEFENRKLNGYIYETRFIASWINAGGNLVYRDDFRKFKKWLSTLGLSDEEVSHIVFLATNGKLELEKSAEEFLKSNKKISYKNYYS